MDYSQVHDPEHPDGVSPWSTSSPGPDRSTFPTSHDSAPSSPTRTRKSTGGAESEEVNAKPKESSVQAPASDPPDEESEDDMTPAPMTNPHQAYRQISQSVPDIRFQGPPMTEEELRQEQLRQQRNEERYQQQLHAQQHQRGPGRYHGTKGPRQASNYKLQARITALERTGKKDPSLHFDVHVRLASAAGIVPTDSCLDQPAQISDHSSP